MTKIGIWFSRSEKPGLDLKVSIEGNNSPKLVDMGELIAKNLDEIQPNQHLQHDPQNEIQCSRYALTSKENSCGTTFQELFDFISTF